LSSSTVDAGFFFIFPFFLIGGGFEPFTIIILAAIALGFLIIFLFPLGLLSRRWKYDDQYGVPAYVRITSVCEHCSTPIPENSTFCSSCGSPVREDPSDRYEPMY
jgi:hypothetical protein